MCCGLSACGTCQTCNGTSPGSCTNAPIGPGFMCNGAGQSCDNMGNCKLANGQSCGVDNTVWSNTVCDTDAGRTHTPLWACRGSVAATPAHIT